MEQKPCIKQFFTDLNQIGIATSSARFYTIHGGNFGVQIDKPFFPLLVTRQDFTLPAIAIQQTTAALYPQLLQAAYNASKFTVDNTAPAFDLIEPVPASGLDYTQYLFSLINESGWNLDKLLTQGWLVREFIDSLDLAATASQYVKALNDFQQFITPVIDKRFFIPPGLYEFTMGGDAFTTLTDITTDLGEIPMVRGLEVIGI